MAGSAYSSQWGFAAMMRPSQGLALVVVVWTLALMTIMAGSFSQTVRRGADLMGAARGQAQAQALAEGGVYYAMMMLSPSDTKRRWRSTGQRYDVALATGRLQISITDEDGKIDINGSSEQGLRELFRQIVGNAPQAERLAQAVLDWRDGDDNRHPQGAERADYVAAGRTVLPQNRNFMVKDELLQVLGMTPVLYSRLQPMITVYTNRNGVNPAKASISVLGLLFHGDQRMIERYLEARSQRDNVPPPVARAGDVVPIPFSASADQVYSVRVDALLETGETASLTAILKQGSDGDGLPFSIVRILNGTDLD